MNHQKAVTCWLITGISAHNWDPKNRCDLLITIRDLSSQPIVELIIPFVNVRRYLLTDSDWLGSLPPVLGQTMFGVFPWFGKYDKLSRLSACPVNMWYSSKLHHSRISRSNWSNHQFQRQFLGVLAHHSLNSWPANSEPSMDLGFYLIILSKKSNKTWVASCGDGSY